MLTTFVLILYVVAAWWSTTGAILLLGRLPPRSYRWSLLGATFVLLAAIWVLDWSSANSTVAGACYAFAAAVLIWGCLEMSFLLGALTGPRRHACAEGCDGGQHFWHAVQSILYHELVTLCALVMIIAECWRAPNAYGMWTFILLWVMRLSAKLNLHFGVPNVGEQMLPPHLKYLSSFFRQGHMNAGFPLSATLAATLSVSLVYGAWDARLSPLHAAGLTLLATLSTLAFFEHVMLVISMPADSFWSWRRGRGAVAGGSPVSRQSLSMTVAEPRPGSAVVNEHTPAPDPEPLYSAASASQGV